MSKGLRHFIFNVLQKNLPESVDFRWPKFAPCEPVGQKQHSTSSFCDDRRTLILPEKKYISSTFHEQIIGII